MIPKRIKYKGQIYEAVIDEAKADELKFREFAGDELADLFYKLKPRMKSPQNDVYYWMKKDVNELKKFIDDISSTKTNKEIRTDAKSGADKLYSDDRWDVLYIKTFDASKYYGANTKWCITGKESGWIGDGQNENIHWKTYTEKGIKFYFYIDKKNNKKYALALYPDGNNYEIFNETDNRIDGIIDAPQVDGLPDIATQEWVIEGTKLYKYNGTDADVVIPDGIETIAEVAFYLNDHIISVEMPNSLKTIGSYAFKGCGILTDVVIPDSVTKIAKAAFADCDSLYNIVIPHGVQEIRFRTFQGCRHLRKVVLSQGVESIDEEAFLYCSSLQTVIIPQSVQHIERNSFVGCDKLTIEYDGTEEQWNTIASEMIRRYHLIGVELPKVIFKK